MIAVVYSYIVFSKGYLSCLLALSIALLLSSNAEVVINEVYYNPEVRGPSLEFIELLNSSDQEVDIGYWHIEDGVEFAFPEKTILKGGGYAVIARDPDALQAKWTVSAFGPWRGKLSNDGESITLRNAEGKKQDEIDYKPGFPWPSSAAGGGASIELIHPSLDNSRGGNWRPSSPVMVDCEDMIFVQAGASGWRFFKGTREPTAKREEWRTLNFSPGSQWRDGRAPIGYADGDDHTVLTDMRHRYTTVYLRKDFDINGTLPEHLLLRVYSDDGAVVWINGKEVARLRAASGELSCRATASPNHEAAWEEIAVSNATTILQQGINVIAMMGLNGSLDSSDFSIDAELRTLPASAIPPQPSPGARNTAFAMNAAPAGRKLSHSPESPKPGDPVTIRVKVTDPDTVTSVVLETQTIDAGDYVPLDSPRYQSDWQRIPMTATEKDFYEVVIAGTHQVHRRLVRYRIIMKDAAGNSATIPYPDDLQKNFAWFCYGQMPAWEGADAPGRSPVKTFSSALQESMPAIHVIARRDDITNSQYNRRFNEQFLTGTAIFAGKVYDHVRFRNRGETTTYMTGKNKWRINFNRGHELTPPIDYSHTMTKAWRRLNLNPGTIPYNPEFRGNASLHERIGFRVHQLAGLPASDTFYLQLRVIDDAEETGVSQYDGDCWGLYMGFEAIDGRFLDNHNLPDGELHKIAQSGSVEKRSAPTGSIDNQFSALAQGMRSRKTESWWRSQIDVDHYATYHAVSIALARHDQKLNHNYSLFRHPDRGWMPLPWDLDMCLWPIAYRPDNFRWLPFLKYSVLHHPALRLHYQNNARELLDLVLERDQIHAMIDELAAPLREIDGHSFAELDAALWNHHPMVPSHHSGTFNKPYIRPGYNSEPIRFSADGINGRIAYFKEYLADSSSHGRSRSGKAHLGWGYRQLANDIRDAQIPERPKVTLDSPTHSLTAICSSFADPDGADTLAFHEWRIAEINHPGVAGYEAGTPCRFESQTLWQRKSATYLPHLEVPLSQLMPGRSYRIRSRFCDTSGRWGHWSHPVTFIAPKADLSLFASLVVTEIMYHPAAPSATERAISPIAADYEFIELTNKGTEPIPLGNLRFSEGIDFSFASSSLIESILPAESIVIVRNRKAFLSRYPDADTRIAGSWGDDRLSDKGEVITLSFGWYQPVTEIEYRDEGDWPEEADGMGASLVFDGENWSASTTSGGTPGRHEEGK